MSHPDRRARGRRAGRLRRLRARGPIGLALGVLLVLGRPGFDGGARAAEPEVHADAADAGARADDADPIARGDAAWRDRAERLEGELAAPGTIERAIEAYRGALGAAPDSIEARWKLLRALHYAIDFTAGSEAAKDARVDEAIGVARAGIEQLEDEARGRPEDRARLYFWSSIAWGTRAGRVGLLTIVREGVARRMHDYAERSLALDPSVDRGGALRLLSRLHGTLPRVPFVSGWVDREKALPYAERAVALDPAHPGSRLILALTLLEQAPERADEARAELRRIVESEPRPDFLVEDLAIRRQAREQLAALEGGSEAG